MSKWINADYWQAPDGQIYDKWNRPVRPSGPTPTPSAPHHNSYSGPQQHYHHHDEIHRTQSAIQALPPARSHSRSRSRDREEYWRMKIEREAQERQELADRAAADARHAQDEADRHEKDVIENARRKEHEKREKEEVERKRMIREAEAQAQDKKRERERMIHEAELEAQEEKRKKKEERERILREAKEEAEAEKKKEEDEMRRYELRKKEKELEAKEKKEKEDKEYLERVQHDMAKFGMSPKYVENMIKYEEKDKKHRLEPGNSRHKHRRSHSKSREIAVVKTEAPTYPKIHRDDIEIETLKHYDIAFERAPDDRDYIILLEELTVEETDVLFEHSKKVREKRRARRAGRRRWW